MTVILGPILGFRGLADGECRTCALVVAEENVAPPELAWFLDNEGRRNEDGSASERTHLKSFKGGFDVWRFDWGVEQRDEEQTVVYTLGEGTGIASACLGRTSRFASPTAPAPASPVLGR